jgi:GDP-L-fucose synthase
VRNTHINIGTGKDISIKDLAHLIKDIVEFKGELIFNASKPDGVMVKLTNLDLFVVEKKLICYGASSLI